MAQSRSGSRGRGSVSVNQFAPVALAGRRRPGEVTGNRYTTEFKAQVALEAIKGELTLSESVAKHGSHPTMIADWKRGY
jgi:hypothetical protein